MIDLLAILCQIKNLLDPNRTLCINVDDPFSDRFDRWVKGPYPYSQVQLNVENYYLCCGQSWSLTKDTSCKLYYSRYKKTKRGQKFDKVNFIVYEHIHSDNNIYHFMYLLRYIDIDNNNLLAAFKKVSYDEDLIWMNRFNYRSNKDYLMKSKKSKRSKRSKRSNKLKKSKLVNKSTSEAITLTSDIVDSIKNQIDDIVDTLPNSANESLISNISMDVNLESDRDSDHDPNQPILFDNVPIVMELDVEIENLGLDVDFENLELDYHITHLLYVGK